MNVPVIRCDVTNEPIPQGEMTYLTYSEVSSVDGTFQRINRGIRLGKTMTAAILVFIDEKRKQRK